MRKVETFSLGSLSTNCCLIYTGENRVVAVDIGGEPDRFLRILREKGLTLSKILLTHGHYDHIDGVFKVQKETGADVYIHKDDAPMLSDGNLNLAIWINPSACYQPVTEYHTIGEGDTIKDGDAVFTVMHTPGHTKGSVCYICDDVILSGDTLFRLSRGRTDFPGGSDSEMLESFRRLKHLHGDFRVFPGHNENTTLEFERSCNPVMKGIL